MIYLLVRSIDSAWLIRGCNGTRVSSASVAFSSVPVARPMTDVEPPGAILDHSEHLFVMCPGEEGFVDLDLLLFPLGERADAIKSACPLL